MGYAGNMLDLTPFADPWEHIRLLSDVRRNQAIVDLLRAYAPGARVAEVGCGTGLWSVVAARLGATEVWAIEPTAVAEVARELVQANHLSDRVVVLEDRIEALDPRPVDLLFSELLNADPFAEGVMEAMEAGAAWMAPGGHLAPSRLDVFAAVIREGDSAAEAAAVQRQLGDWSSDLGLNLGPLQDLVAAPEPYPYIGHASTRAGPPVRVWSLELGHDSTPEEAVSVVLPVEGGGAVHGVVVWFEATLAPGLVLRNPPGAGGHWGHWIAGFASPLRADSHGVAVQFEVEDNTLAISIA